MDQGKQEPTIAVTDLQHLMALPTNLPKADPHSLLLFGWSEVLSGFHKARMEGFDVTDLYVKKHCEKGPFKYSKMSKRRRKKYTRTLKIVNRKGELSPCNNRVYSVLRVFGTTHLGTPYTSRGEHRGVLGIDPGLEGFGIHFPNKEIYHDYS